ncbi:hypothetical protein ACOMHN_066431 [Nucella lapillus]
MEAEEADTTSDLCHPGALHRGYRHFIVNDSTSSWISALHRKRQHFIVDIGTSSWTTATVWKHRDSNMDNSISMWTVVPRLRHGQQHFIDNRGNHREYHYGHHQPS